MQNRGQEKKSMRGASGFAEIVYAVRCESLSYLLSFEIIHIKY